MARQTQWLQTRLPPPPPHQWYKKKKGRSSKAGMGCTCWQGDVSVQCKNTQLHTDLGWEDHWAVPSCWQRQGRWRTPRGRRGEAAAAASARPEAGAAYRPAWSCPRQHLRTKHRTDVDVMHCSCYILLSVSTLAFQHQMGPSCCHKLCNYSMRTMFLDF